MCRYTRASVGVAWRLRLDRRRPGTLRAVRIAPTSIAALLMTCVACGASSGPDSDTSAGKSSQRAVLVLINNLPTSVSVAHCADAQPGDCVDQAKPLAPGKQRTWALRELTLGDSPDVLRATVGGKARCFLLPPGFRPTLIVHVTDFDSESC